MSLKKPKESKSRELIGTMKDYLVAWGRGEESHILATNVEICDEMTLRFYNKYDANSVEEMQETVAVFRYWDYFVLCKKEAL